jgi:hypothetical protein
MLPTLPFDGGWFCYGFSKYTALAGSFLVAVLVVTSVLPDWIIFAELFGLLQFWIACNIDASADWRSSRNSTSSATQLSIAVVLVSIMVGTILMVDPASLRWFL